MENWNTDVYHLHYLSVTNCQPATPSLSAASWDLLYYLTHRGPQTMDMDKRDSRALMIYQLQNYLFVITVAENFSRLYFIEGLARLILLGSGPPLLAVRTSSQLGSSGFFLDSSMLNSLLGFLKKKCPHLLQAIRCNTVVASLFWRI